MAYCFTPLFISYYKRKAAVCKGNSIGIHLEENLPLRVDFTSWNRKSLSGIRKSYYRGKIWLSLNHLQVRDEHGLYFHVHGCACGGRP